jgi:hypothetical protein
VSLFDQLERFNQKVADIENNFLHNYLVKEIEQLLKHAGDKTFLIVFGSNLDIATHINYKRITEDSLRWAMRKFIIIKDNKYGCNEANIKDLLDDITDSVMGNLSSKKFKKTEVDDIKKKAQNYLKDKAFLLTGKFNLHLFEGLMKAINVFCTYLDELQADFFVNNSSDKFYEITQYLSNNVLNEGTKKFSINLFNDRSKRIVINEKLLNEKLLKNSKIVDPLKNCELTNVFPTNTETNIIIMKFQNQNNLHKKLIANFYLIISAYGENTRKITELHINDCFFHFYPDEQTLFVFDYEKTELIKYKVEDNKLNKIADYHYKDKKMGVIQSCIYIPKMSKFIIINKDGKVYNLSGVDDYKARPLYKQVKRRDIFEDQPMISISKIFYHSAL